MTILKNSFNSQLLKTIKEEKLKTLRVKLIFYKEYFPPPLLIINLGNIDGVKYPWSIKINQEIIRIKIYKVI